MSKPKIVVIGSLNMDIVVETDVIPQEGETVLGNKAYFIPGGKGANQSVALARLGAEVEMIGAVGKDSFGQEMLAAMRAEGIGYAAVKQIPEAATGIALIQLCQKDNRITVVPGANHCCLPVDVDAHEELIKEADLVLLQMEIPLETVAHAARIAKKHGKTVILNPAPAQVLGEELLQQIDYITPNRSELAILAGSDSTEAHDVLLMMNNLQKKGVRNVVTTLGGKGAAFLDENASLRTSPSFDVDVVDTTGAGDAFNAGLTYLLANGASLAEAAAFAGRVAALSVTKLGAQAGMPTHDEVMTKGMCLHEKVLD